MDLSLGCYQGLIHDPYYKSALPKTYQFLKKYKIKLKIPMDINGLKLRHQMDALLIHIMPIFKKEFLEYYEDGEYTLIDRYKKKGCDVIDNTLLIVVKYNLTTKQLKD